MIAEHLEAGKDDLSLLQTLIENLRLFEPGF